MVTILRRIKKNVLLETGLQIDLGTNFLFSGKSFPWNSLILLTTLCNLYRKVYGFISQREKKNTIKPKTRGNQHQPFENKLQPIVYCENENLINFIDCHEGSQCRHGTKVFQNSLLFLFSIKEEIICRTRCQSLRRGTVDTKTSSKEIGWNRFIFDLKRCRDLKAKLPSLGIKDNPLRNRLLSLGC